ncbi:MAG: M1 family metallopeptidase [Sphingobacteriales bacterium]|nr:M1 family metallopeptidase [Sphingobacteriales bacterium]
MIKYCCFVLLCIAMCCNEMSAQSFLNQPRCNRQALPLPLENVANNARSDSIDIHQYSINLDATDFSGKKIKGYCIIAFSAKISGIDYINLDLLGLQVDSVLYQGNSIPFTHSGELLHIPLGTVLTTGTMQQLTVYYQGTPQQDASGWGGFYYSGNYAFNLGVGFAANPHNYGRVWFPCFDNFVERSIYRFIITSPAGRNAHCNGYLEGNTINADNSVTSVWQMDTEIPTYLACVAIGNYVTVQQQFASSSGKQIPIALAVVPEDTTKIKNSFIHLTKALQSYEKWYGAYQWNKVGYSVVPFSSGAMEHATNIAYPKNAVNGTTAQETLMAHELSHHWWGNWATCETAEDMWINEGIASYSEHLFIEDVYGRKAYLEEALQNHIRVLETAHREEGGYLAISGVPHELTYGTHVYKKGAAMMHNLRGYLGDELLQTGFHSIIDNYALQSINSYQFRDQLTAAGGKDMHDFFEAWIFHGGYSDFVVDSVKSNFLTQGFHATIYIRQKLRGAPAFHQNVPLQLVVADPTFSQRDTLNITASGEYTTIEADLPFWAEVAYINPNYLLHLASVHQDTLLSNAGNYTLDKAKMTVSLNQQLAAPAFLHVAHHWTAPDTLRYNPWGAQLSASRFWEVKGNFNPLYTGAQLRYDGSATGNYLDEDLVAADEQNMLLLYRETAADEWQKYDFYTLNGGSSSDKKGTFNLTQLFSGQYCFAKSDTAPTAVPAATAPAVGSVQVFPNPSTGLFRFESSAPLDKVVVFSVNGEYLEEQTLSHNRQGSFELKRQTAGGIYLLRFYKGQQEVQTLSVQVR